MTPFDDRLVVITGAGCGIGRATALRFAERGATVIVTDIDSKRADETVRLVRRAAGCAHAYTLDVADYDAWELLALTLEADHGVADVLVNNAGYTTGGHFFDHSVADWEGMLRVNVLGVIQGARVFAQRMIVHERRGAIVNVASGAAYIPIPLSTLYCATKAAVKSSSECLHAELHRHGIGVTAICPGFINTAFYEDARHVGVSADEAELRTSMISGLAKRIAHDPDVVARAIVDASIKRPVVKPVTLESQFGYLLSRLSPGLLRAGARYVTADRVSGLATEVLPSTVREWIGAAR